MIMIARPPHVHMHALSSCVRTCARMVQGVECMIVANDATVKGGTYYPITVPFIHPTAMTNCKM